MFRAGPACGGLASNGGSILAKVDFGELSESTRTLLGAPSAFVVPVAGPPLAGMPYPRDDVEWDAVAASGVARVLDLSGLPCGYDCTPLERVPLDLQDLAGGRLPNDEEREREQIRGAVDVITATREALDGVVVHCEGGRGRTGTVLGAYLVTLGHAPSVVSHWLNQLYASRGQSGWPESRWQSDLLEEFR